MSATHRCALALLAALFVATTPIRQAAAQDKPNILVIWGDDVGMWNISAYHRGMMGGTTPNIDSLAKEGMMFMDHYAQASCTAGRAAFLLGQQPMRTGLLTVGIPGAKQGIQASDPTIAELLKPYGYATGQFGKNHFGDRDEYLPTMHGFDEFYGILYHLNAAQYVEQYDYPSKEEAKKWGFAVRGIIHSKSDGKGGQTVKELGPWGTEVQRHLDEDVLKQSKRFMKEAVDAGKPFFVWHNFIRMHYPTHQSAEWKDKTGYGVYADGMAEMDHNVGELIKYLEELGVADNTFIMFATDNGAATNSWPDGGNQPFHGEKGAGGWEGAFRVPVIIKWKNHIPENVSTGEFMAMEDWMPTIMSMAVGDKNLKSDLLKGKSVGGKTYKNHLDGYDQSELVLKNGKSMRKEFFYFTETTFHAVRYGDWKFMFVKQEDWFQAPQLPLSTPIITNLKLDPFERMHKTRGYGEWQEQRGFMTSAAARVLGEFMKSLKDYPPSQPSDEFKLSDAFSKLSDPSK
jgi:arylsulfatase